MLTGQAPPTYPLDLDPSQIERSTYASRRRRHLVDVTAMLCLLLVLAILVRAALVVPQMPAGLGRPAMIVGLVLSLGWIAAKLHPRLTVRGPQPLRWAAAMYLLGIGLAYAAGHLRGLTPLEAGGADRAMIATAIFLGVALVCADGVPNRARLHGLLRVLTWLAGIMAAIGIAQFSTGLNLVDYIQVPGLVGHHGQEGAIGFRDRGDGLFQVASTARHYIEFSAVMALVLPIAIHTARFNATRVSRQWAFVAAIAMATAIPLTLSRTGILAIFVGLIVLGLFWTWRIRFNILVIGTLLLSTIMVVRPGVLGTIRSLFTNMGDDPSIEGRTDDYDAAALYFAERPWFGRGPGTFIPTMYQWIDNEWLLHVITTGIVGTLALAAWHVTAATLAAIAYWRSTRDEDRHLCGCLISVQVMAALMAGTYDSMSFTTHVIVLAVLSGAAGAMWRLTHPRRQVRSAASGPLGHG